MARRNFLVGALGWVIPGALALPVAWTSESSGGESALLAFTAWGGLSVLGCAIAGGAVSADAGGFWSGLAGVAAAGLAAVAACMAVETYVRVLHFGALTYFLPIPLVLSYSVVFGLGVVFSRLGSTAAADRRVVDQAQPPVATADRPLG